MFTVLSSYLNNMAISCLPKNIIFDNSNFTSAYIAQLVEHFHGKEEVASSILAVGTKNNRIVFTNEKIAIDESFPKYILNNKEKFKEWII